MVRVSGVVLCYFIGTICLATLMGSGKMWGLIMGAAVAVYLHRWQAAERRIRQRRQAMFAGRTPLPFSQIYEKFYAPHGYERSQVCHYWHEIASLLNLDPERLRPQDSIYAIFAAREGEYIDDIGDLEELMDILSAGAPMPYDYDVDRVQAVDDVIKVCVPRM